MNIIVTGGAGFIGSSFILYTMSRRPEDRVVCLDKLTYAGDLSNLSAVLDAPNFRFVRADICDGAAVDSVFCEERPDYVVNFAAESHVDRSIEDPGVFLRSNVLGVQTLLDACRRYNVRRFHQVSTDEVYGDLPLDRPDLRFTEDSPLRPSSPYSASKTAYDLLVMAFRRTYGLPITVSRCSNNYGPRQFPEKLIPLAVLRAMNGEPIPVFGQGLNVRDWIYVEDHCAAVDLILRRGRDGEVYNVGGGCEMRNIDVVSLICQKLGKPRSLISHVPDRPGHDRRYALDIGKIRALGWEPQTDFAQGLERTVEWYSSLG